MGRMDLDRERFDVCPLARDFWLSLARSLRVAARTKPALRDQFGRASSSILLNLAEERASTRARRATVLSVRADWSRTIDSPCSTRANQWKGIPTLRARARLRENLNSATGSTSPRSVWSLGCICPCCGRFRAHPKRSERRCSAGESRQRIAVPQERKQAACICAEQHRTGQSSRTCSLESRSIGRTARGRRRCTGKQPRCRVAVDSRSGDRKPQSASRPYSAPNQSCLFGRFEIRVPDSASRQRRDSPGPHSSRPAGCIGAC